MPTILLLLRFPLSSLSFSFLSFLLYSTFAFSFPSIPLGYSKQVVMYCSTVLPMVLHTWQGGSNLWQFSWLVILSYEIPYVKHCVCFYKKYISLTNITPFFLPRSQVIRRRCPYHTQHCLEMWETYKSKYNIYVQNWSYNFDLNLEVRQKSLNNYLYVCF